MEVLTSVSNRIHPFSVCSLARELLSETQLAIDKLDSEIAQAQQYLNGLINQHLLKIGRMSRPRV
jgi:hypothetical protein